LAKKKTTAKKKKFEFQDEDQETLLLNGLKQGTGLYENCLRFGIDIVGISERFNTDEQFRYLITEAVQAGYVDLMLLKERAIKKDKFREVEVIQESIEDYNTNIITWRLYFDNEPDMIISQVAIEQAILTYGPNNHDIACSLGLTMFEYIREMNMNPTLKYQYLLKPKKK